MSNGARSGALDPHAVPEDQAIPAEVLRAALEWQVTLWSGETTAAEQQAFEHWRSADPVHERAWQEVQSMRRQLHAAPDAVASSVLRTAKKSNARRKTLRGLGLIAGIGILAAAVRNTPQWQSAMAQYRTGVGEQRDVTLPDGTLVTLNTATAIDLRFGTLERRVLLRAGEILVATAPDRPPEGASAPRPFIVETAEGSIRALGTRFTVRQLDAASWVQVLEGAVEIAPRAGDETPVRLEAGQQARFSRSAVEPLRAVDATAAAWTRGMLVAERQRLADFLAELSRYRRGVLRCDPAVADLVVSGVYPLADTDRVLQSLAQALPVRVTHVTRYWVTVGAR